MTVYFDSAPYPKVNKGTDPAMVRLLKEDSAEAIKDANELLDKVDVLEQAYTG